MRKAGTLNRRGKRIRKPGPLSQQEKRIALSLKVLNPFLTAAAIGKSLNRSKRPIVSYLLEARTMLQESAPLVAGHMIQASAIAAAQGDHRPAAWILGAVSAVDDKGNTVRVVERPEVLTAQGLTVNIGLQVGNIPAADTRAEVIASLPLEVSDVVVSDCAIKT